MKILALVLAGGNGTRLHPLTADHAKPALPFAAGYRIIDFVLGNLVNSGIPSIYVLAQYKPRSLIEHIRTAWVPRSRGREPAISVVLPGTCGGSTPFRGTADAVYQNLHLIKRHKPDLVAVFAADHVYRMDVRQMARFHLDRGAEVTIAGARVPIAQGSAFGVMAVNAAGELHEFLEKPERPVPTPDDADRTYASMGNYLFNPRVLVELLEECTRNGGTDFGHHIMPILPRRHRVFAYDFARNTVPGAQPYEERGYWRDIGTIDAYKAAQRDVLGPLPCFSLVNPKWPIRSDAYLVRRPNAPTAPKMEALMKAEPT
ncbi:MAG: sugar phosphate nucleotidyltransferase [Immundisolibacter sp.]|uniref:sugar phosphate nucleotidyltransferase n=1 Tax=Immundisolibacter sp. TaxID=1934948 RepID=UPI003EE0D4CC